MKKITDFSDITKYFCTQCNTFHSKIRNRKPCKAFKEHKEFAVILEQSELFKLQFKKNWNHNINHPKLTKNISMMFINEPLIEGDD